MNHRWGKWLYDRLPGALLIFSLCLGFFVWGIYSQSKHVFPYQLIGQAKSGYLQFLNFVDYKHAWFYKKTNIKQKVTIYDRNATYPGLNLIVAVAAHNRLVVDVVDIDGTPVHHWNIDWFELWPDAQHIPTQDLPRSRPGTHVHGVQLMENGDLVFNFEHMGLMRVDPCGMPVWRLPYRTHHSVYLDDSGNLWVSGQRNHTAPLKNYPNHRPPFVEPVILQVSPSGALLKEVSVFDLLRKFGLEGLLYMATTKNSSTAVSGDILHLNDVEVFPNSLPEGVFSAGDVMISLRNINTVLVFDKLFESIKYKNIGGFVRQHDPDFVDGNTISVFDNNNRMDDPANQSSRILIEEADTGLSAIHYSGMDDAPFFTKILGKHQWLANGNLLISESVKGRAFEITKNDRIVWEYVNIVEPGFVGLMEEVQRLPTRYDKQFFTLARQSCAQARTLDPP